MNMVQYLISEAHCDPSCVTSLGDTPLHFASKATPSGITVSGLDHSLLSRRAGGSTHYAIIHHSNLKVI